MTSEDCSISSDDKRRHGATRKDPLRRPLVTHPLHSPEPLGGMRVFWIQVKSRAQAVTFRGASMLFPRIPSSSVRTERLEVATVPAPQDQPSGAHRTLYPMAR